MLELREGEFEFLDNYENKIDRRASGCSRARPCSPACACRAANDGAPAHQVSLAARDAGVSRFRARSARAPAAAALETDVRRRRALFRRMLLRDRRGRRAVLQSGPQQPRRVSKPRAASRFGPSSLGPSRCRTGACRSKCSRIPASSPRGRSRRSVLRAMPRRSRSARSSESQSPRGARRKSALSGLAEVDEKVAIRRDGLQRAQRASRPSAPSHPARSAHRRYATGPETLGDGLASDRPLRCRCRRNSKLIIGRVSSAAISKLEPRTLTTRTAKRGRSTIVGKPIGDHGERLSPRAALGHRQSNTGTSASQCCPSRCNLPWKAHVVSPCVSLSREWPSPSGR